MEVPSFNSRHPQELILSIFDSINNNLLEQALCLYELYFSSYPKSGQIGDYCCVKSGFAFKSSWWTEEGVKVIKIGSINQDNLNLEDCSYVDNDKIPKAKEFIVREGDIVIAMTGATIGKFAMIPSVSETILVNQRVGKFFLGDHPIDRLPFLYCTLKQKDIYSEIINRGQGSAQPNVSGTDIMTIPCVIPNADDIATFNKVAQPMFETILANQTQNTKLMEIRDSLLPRLLAGILDVSAVEI